MATSIVDERLDGIYALGAGPGANRPGGSQAEHEAHELVGRWLEQAGLEVEVDPDLNLIGRLPGTEAGLPEVWTGSHLDSVPRGGKFDGALGVVAGLAAVERIGRQRATLAVVAFRDEERGCAGSGALVERGVLPGVFLESHVEQGPLLERAGSPLGVATGIVGYARRVVAVEGRADHAGTTPMDGRDDALCQAAELILWIRELATSIEGAVATVGRLEVEPGAVNVIPDRATLTLDLRAPDQERLDALVATVQSRTGVELDVRSPVQLAPRATRTLHEAVCELGLRPLELVSGAGHDAGVLARAGVEAGLLFVRSLNGGASHSPDELSSPEDVSLCVDALAIALHRFASGTFMDT